MDSILLEDLHLLRVLQSRILLHAKFPQICYEQLRDMALLFRLIFRSDKKYVLDEVVNASLPAATPDRLHPDAAENFLLSRLLLLDAPVGNGRTIGTFANQDF